MAKRKKVALVTGGNRGIGFEVCRELAKAGCTVILAGRSDDRVAAAVKKLKRSKLDVVGLTLDHTDVASVARAEKFVRTHFGRLHILVNNAAVFLDIESTRFAETVDIEAFRATMESNVIGPLRLIKTFLPIMRQQNYGRIVNVSSGMGQLSRDRSGWIGYCVSKTALNSLTRLVHNELTDTNIKCNAVSPGWVRTDMGGPNAERTPKKGAETIVWLALLGNDSPSGGFYRDKKPIEW